MSPVERGPTVPAPSRGQRWLQLAALALLVGTAVAIFRPFLVPLAPNESPQLVSKRVRGYGEYLTSPANQPIFSDVWLA